MTDAALTAEPGGLHAVYEWLGELFSAQPSQRLWVLLDDRLRLALAQGWVLRGGGPDDDLAEELADDDASGQAFTRMLTDLIAHWRSNYAILRQGSGGLHQVILVGADRELVVLTSPEHIGHFPTGAQIPAHSFITHLETDEWFIAALARRLPVPGWPPTEQRIPGLEIDP